VSGLVRGVAIGGRGLVTGVALGGSVLVRGVAFGGRDLVRGVALGGSGLVRGLAFGGSGLVTLFQWKSNVLAPSSFLCSLYIIKLAYILNMHEIFVD
jgi:hypothetical protein